MDLNEAGRGGAGAAAAGLPIFPLPRVVLLPGEELHLHVFEQRYRALVRHCRATDSPFGLATLRGGVDAHGRPEIHSELGVGVIVGHRPLPDGRSDIVVRYAATAWALGEVVSHDPFRRVACSWRAPVPPASYPDFAALRMMAMQVATRVSVPIVSSPWWSAPGEAWLHGAARLFLTDADSRRAYLHADSGAARVTLVRDALAAIVEHVVPVLED